MKEKNFANISIIFSYLQSYKDFITTEKKNAYKSLSSTYCATCSAPQGIVPIPTLAGYLEEI